MTRILRNTFSAALLTSAAIMLAGCPAGTGAVIPGATGVGGTTATTPGGTTTTPTTGAAACTRNAATGTPAEGTSVHGKYNKQLLPDGWATAHKSEADVTAAIAKLEAGIAADWNCFQKFYGGAYTQYKK